MARHWLGGRHLGLAIGCPIALRPRAFDGPYSLFGCPLYSPDYRSLLCLVIRISFIHVYVFPISILSSVDSAHQIQISQFELKSIVVP
jgi:hypothetical protein